jgi:hypothetical protein
MPRSEELCRFWFQWFVAHPFKKKRPSFLDKLELDGYCTHHQLAFEYQGIQHYHYIRHFHPTIEDFRKQIERDRLKRMLCQSHHVFLIQVPYLYNFRDTCSMSSFIFHQLRHAERVCGKRYIQRTSLLELNKTGVVQKW